MVDLSAGEYCDCVRLCVVSEEADTTTINQITFRDRRSRVLNRVNIHTHPTQPASDRRMYNKNQLCGRAEMSRHQKKQKKSSGMKRSDALGESDYLPNKTR